MAKCEYCNKEMEGADSCIPRVFKIGKKVYEQIKFGDEKGWEEVPELRPGHNDRCPDCKV